MSYKNNSTPFNVVTIPPFDRQLKRLVKKYPSLKTEYAELLAALQDTPDMGISLGNSCYKIKISIASKGRGKSGGARVISYIQIVEHSVVLLSIFDKSDQENIPDQELNDLLKMI